nr:MAG: hypothetical protein 1 [Tombusviridae sp.]
MATDALAYSFNVAMKFACKIPGRIRSLETKAVAKAIGEEALLDTNISSSRILEELHRDKGLDSFNIKPDTATAVTVIAFGLGYGGYRLIRSYWMTNKASPLLDHHLSVAGALREELSTLSEVDEVVEEAAVVTAPVAELVNPPSPTIMIGQIPVAVDNPTRDPEALGLVADGFEIAADPRAVPIPPPTPIRRRTTKHKFLTHVILSGKNRFYGLPTPTVSNMLAVNKYVAELCDNKGCLPHQTRQIMAIAVPAIFSPDEWDVSSAQAFNIDERAHNRSRLARAGKIDSWLTNILCAPLSGKGWKRMFDQLMGLPDWQAHRLVK